MELSTALDIARGTNQSILVTQRGNGRPQISNVVHWLGADGHIYISITADRAKYANLRRTPWAALHISAGDFWKFAVIEGDVELSEVAAAVDDEVTDQLTDLFPKLTGNTLADEAQFRQQQVTERRVVVRVTPTRAYGRLPAPGQ
jgi:PPOX class probable F420-dependent enzyme